MIKEEFYLIINDENNNKFEFEKGDLIIYPFGFGIQEARVVRVYPSYLKVSHGSNRIFGFKDIVKKEYVLDKKN